MGFVVANRDGKMSFQEAVEIFCSQKVSCDSDSELVSEVSRSADPGQQFITHCYHVPPAHARSL